MCMVSTPSINNKGTPPQYLHNPLLDGSASSDTGAIRGRNSLRIALDNKQGALNTPIVSPSTTGGGLNVPQIAPTVARKPPSGRNLTSSVSGLPSASSHPASKIPGRVIPTVGGALAGSVMMGSSVDISEY